MKNYSSIFSGYEKTNAPAMDFRRKERERVKYYRSGKLKSVYLNEQTGIETQYGVIPCELITFYESGAINRIFPRYGAISAYWSQKDEAAITQEVHLQIGGASYDIRPQCLKFYESGKIYSITIYDHEELELDTEYGPIRTNVGISFYEDGKVKSIEPSFKTIITIDGKTVRPFDFWADHMHADHNSMIFDREGKFVSYCGAPGE